MKKAWQHRKKNLPTVMLVKPCCDLDEWAANDEGPHEDHDWYEEEPTTFAINGNRVSRIQTISWNHCPGVPSYKPDPQHDPLNMNDDAGVPYKPVCLHGVSCECPPA